MTVVQLRATVDADDRLERARRALDVTALVARGWDAERHVFAPSPDDPLFGWAPCERSGCARGARGPAARRLGLCELCLVNYRSRYQGQLSVTEYKRKPVRREVDRSLCGTPAGLGVKSGVLGRSVDGVTDAGPWPAIIAT